MKKIQGKEELSMIVQEAYATLCDLDIKSAYEISRVNYLRKDMNPVIVINLFVSMLDG